LGKSVFRLLGNSFILLHKDIQLEFRTRYAVNAILMFAITTLVAISFSIGPVQLQEEVTAPLLWIVLFFSAITGLSHIFVREEEQQTSDTLRLVTTPTAVFLSKWLFNIILLGGLEIIIIPLYLVMMNVEILNFSIFFSILILGSIALASVATIIAAIIAQASTKGALFAVLVFPIALPVLISAIDGTKLSLVGAPFFDCLPDLQVLFSFSIVIITISLLVFEHIWRR